MIRALLLVALLLLPWAFACSGAPINRDNTTADQMWCIAGHAAGAPEPVPYLRCSDTRAQCELDRAAAWQDKAVTSVSPCRSTVVAVHLRETGQ